MAQTDNPYSRKAATKDSTCFVYVRGAREPRRSDAISNPSHRMLSAIRPNLRPSCQVADVGRLITQLELLVDAGNTVIVVEHDMRVVAGSDWVIDIGPGAGEEGGRTVSRALPRLKRPNLSTPRGGLRFLDVHLN